MSEVRGSLDFHDEMDRWQMLSRELAQKQELIHATLKKKNDIEAHISQKGEEITALRLGLRYNQSQVH